MGVSTCDTCRQPFSWGKIFTSLCAGYKPIHCSQCSTTHKITMGSRFLTSISIVLPIVILGNLFLHKWSFSILYATFTLLFVGIISSLPLPFLVKYRAK
ncbi:TIGR04104 family putative zinc finger protein [Bacillus sp. THAF10]|uniref:TIGR04104 family putative zinc finger protein n=1 Tax=Bacillus sp. THAF10 TaxID=2587848 RepID=UPI0012684CB2